MTVILIALQIGLPVLLLVWLEAFPASGAAAYAVHAAAAALVLLALGLVAMDAMPAWWVPYLYGLAFAAILSWHLASERIGAAARCSKTGKGSS